LIFFVGSTQGCEKQLETWKHQEEAEKRKKLALENSKKQQIKVFFLSSVPVIVVFSFFIPSSLLNMPIHSFSERLAAKRWSL